MGKSLELNPHISSNVGPSLKWCRCTIMRYKHQIQWFSFYYLIYGGTIGDSPNWPQTQLSFWRSCPLNKAEIGNPASRPAPNFLESMRILRMQWSKLIKRRKEPLVTKLPNTNSHWDGSRRLTLRPVLSPESERDTQLIASRRLFQCGLKPHLRGAYLAEGMKTQHFWSQNLMPPPVILFLQYAQ